MKSGRRLSLWAGALSLVSAAGVASCSADGSRGAPVQVQPPGPPGQWQPPLPVQPPVQPLAPQPPAISGGTLIVQKDGTTAVASDPDEDVVWIVDLGTQTVRGYVALQPGDEPGRLVEDAAGHVHVALRRGGALVSIDPASGKVLARRAVCPAPRGVAYDASLDAVHVACSDGLLATFPAAGGAATRTVRPDGDLRDVIVEGGTLYVSRFRTAELLRLAGDGTVAERTTLPNAASIGPMGVTTAMPGVAYRTVALPGGGVAMLHQRSQVEAVATTPGGYTTFGMCPGVGIVHDAISFIQPGQQPAIASPLMMITLAVDLALSPDGTSVAVAAPGTQFGTTVAVYPLTFLQQPVPDGGMPPCSPPPSGQSVAGEAIAVAYDGQGRLVVQSREPSVLTVDGAAITLPGTTITSSGHNTFHMGTKGGIACASCHPEGGDDGRVWQFTGLGARRTQNLQGGVLSRMPFHWSGDIADMPTLVSVVLMGRMDGPSLTDAQTQSLGQWIDAQAALAPPPPPDAAAVTRGAAIFNDPAIGCTACHSGPQLSTHQLVDVGTGGVFKVPSLIGVGYRAPYLHDGCAATLADRFGPTCGGGDQHGKTSHLDPWQISDLIAFLGSL